VIEKWVGVLSDWLCWLSALCIVGMMLLTSSDVALRYVGFPIKGTYDVVGLLGALVVALPIARTQVLNRHVSMEFMAQRKSRIARGIAQAITSVLGIAVYATVTWQLVAFAAKLKAIGRVSDTVEIPLYPFVYAIAVAFLLTCVVLLVQFFVFVRPARE